MKTIYETWKGGVLVNRTETDDAGPDEIILRDAVQQAITDLQTIQDAPLTTEAAQITAIKQEAIILQKLIRFIARKL